MLMKDVSVWAPNAISLRVKNEAERISEDCEMIEEYKKGKILILKRKRKN
jgi:hypothetical protein